jgi:hypothetical protein
MRPEGVINGVDPRAVERRGSVLIVAFNYLPERIVGVLRPARFARLLPRYGYDTTILTATPQPEDAPPNIRQLPYIRTFPEKVIRRFFLPGEESIPWAGSAARTAAAMHRETPFSAVFVTSPPWAVQRVGLYLKKKFAVPWVADFRDPMRGSSVRLDYAFPLHDGIFEPRVFRHADAVIANTDAVAKLWRKRYPQWSEKFQTIWNGYDPDEEVGPAPLPPRPFRVLGHFGEVFEYRHPGALLASVARLIGRGLLDPATLRIRFCGGVQSLGDPEIRHDLEARGVIELAPLPPFAEALQEMAQSDYLLVIDFTTGAPGLQVPSKLYTYLRIGRPVLALTTPESPVSRILRNSGIRHACICPDAPAGRIDAEVLDFLRLPTDPIEPSSWFRENFDCTAQARTLAAIIDRISKGRDSGGGAARLAGARRCRAAASKLIVRFRTP